MREKWLPITGFDGIYFVSNLGRIRRKNKRGKWAILKGSAAGNGYRKIILCDYERQDHRYIHHIVLEAFVGPRPKGCETCHGDGDRKNNRVDNLRWDTRKNNFADKLAHGTQAWGETHPLRKLSAAEVIAIRMSKGSCTQLGEQYGIGRMQISRIRNRKNWAHLP
jgi:hypothetical protein